MYRGGGSVAIIGACHIDLRLHRIRITKVRKCSSPSSTILARGRRHSLIPIQAAGDASKIVSGRSHRATGRRRTEVRSPRWWWRKTEQAKEIITEMLSNGPQSEHDVKSACLAASVSERTYWTARKQMGVVSERSGFGGNGRWQLSMPAEMGPRMSRF